MNKKIIAIIPARGGSKGIPRKNIKDLAGKPMIAYIIESVKKVQGVDRVIVSTEDEEIYRVAKKYGAEAPFMRPIELAQDEVATLPVLRHAVKYLLENENYSPDYVLLVYPTSPLLKAERIQEIIDLGLEKNSDSVISGTYDKGHYWIESDGGWERLYPTELRNRQLAKSLFKENGAIYLIRTSILEKQLVADKTDIFVMDLEENIDVDTMEDFKRVEIILQKNNQ